MASCVPCFRAMRTCESLRAVSSALIVDCEYVHRGSGNILLFCSCQLLMLVLSTRFGQR